MLWSPSPAFAFLFGGIAHRDGKEGGRTTGNKARVSRAAKAAHGEEGAARQQRETGRQPENEPNGLILSHNGYNLKRELIIMKLVLSFTYN